CCSTFAKVQHDTAGVHERLDAIHGWSDQCFCGSDPCFCGKSDQGVWEFLYETLEPPFTPAERLYFVISGLPGIDDANRGERRFYCSSSAEFWKEICGESNPHPDFLRWFASEA